MVGPVDGRPRLCQLYDFFPMFRRQDVLKPQTQAMGGSGGARGDPGGRIDTRRAAHRDAANINFEKLASKKQDSHQTSSFIEA